MTTPQSERAEPPEVMEDTGFAAPTAATDGRRVFAIFANGDIAGFTVDGKRLWARSLGTPENMYGHATSLTMWRNRVIVVFDQADAKAGKSKIMALDATTGEPVWSTPSAVANSWVSPIVIKHQGREQIITSADPWVIAYDPATGKELWQAKCMRGDVAPSPVYANDLVYVACDQTCIAAHPARRHRRRDRQQDRVETGGCRPARHVQPAVRRTAALHPGFRHLPRLRRAHRRAPVGTRHQGQVPGLARAWSTGASTF